MLTYLYIIIGLAILIPMFIKILREYERAVVFTFGRFTAVKGPGLIIIIPFVQQIERVELRTIAMDVPSQDVISRDNVSVKVNAVLYYRVIDSERAIVNVAEAEDIDIIVMGSVTRTGIAGLLMGNTAETVLGAVRRSVFAIKPTGFQTPVTIEDRQAKDVA